MNNIDPIEQEIQAKNLTTPPSPPEPPADPLKAGLTQRRGVR